MRGRIIAYESGTASVKRPPYSVYMIISFVLKGWALPQALAIVQ
jgi:hypothetical protein